MSAPAIQGILQGSSWCGFSGGYARVVDAIAGYVRFLDERGSLHVLHHFRFRDLFDQTSQTRAVPGILVGSTWLGHAGGYARVLGTDCGCVDFMDQGGEIRREHHLQFRARFDAPYDASAVRSQFTMSIANLISLHAFWSPSLKRLLARSSNRSIEDSRKAARGSPALPPDAFHVGTYAQPVDANAFFTDLNDALAIRAAASAV
jgi:hypothetical protein